MAYSTLQLGSTGADVRTLKRLLNSAGFSLNEDETFDEATSQAVSSYQAANRLTANGTADAATWAKLAANAVTAMPGGMSAAENVKYLENNRPAAYSSAYAARLDEMLNDILNREKFSYNPVEDDLYKRFRDQYLYMGIRAMNDARGGAASLTGGYDNSYAEAAGQQAYQNHVAQMSNKIPELYQLALSAYDAETGRLNDRLGALTEAEKTAYDRYKDDMDAYAEALKYYYQKMQDEAKAKSSGGGGDAKKEEEPVDAAAVHQALPNILTQSEFQRRKASSTNNLQEYRTYADYVAAMKKKYGI